MNLILYKQFADAYYQCICTAFEQSGLQGEVKRIAPGLPTEGITIAFEDSYCPVIPVREAFLRAEMFDTWEEELADRAMEVFQDAQSEELRIAVSQMEQPENVGIYAANHRMDLEALKKNNMPYIVYGDVVIYFMHYAALGDGRYYQSEVTNSHLETWKMKKNELYQFVAEHSLVPEENIIYPLNEKISDMLIGIPCGLGSGEAEDSLGYVVTGPGGVATVLYWDVLRELSKLMPDSFYILPYSEREAYVLPDTMGVTSPAFSIEEVHKNGNRQVRRSLAGYAISSHGFHYSPETNKLETIKAWKKGL